MGADQIGVVDIGVVQISVGLHLRLHRLHDFAFAEQLVVDPDAGNFLEGLGQHFGFVGVGRYRLGEDVDLHADKRLGRLDEPLHLLDLLVARQRRGLEFLVDPFLSFRHSGEAGARICEDGSRCDCRHKLPFHVELPPWFPSFRTRVGALSDSIRAENESQSKVFICSAAKPRQAALSRIASTRWI